ncbi:MAG TPA: cyclic nucleotide-binding domain-containing protein [Jatrophihabitantaceae bacterium]|jgi:CRP-like cAMP-binding protein|nr:cyclic nucleotide-binding domain-containing protein [Jatrophihabitantaceae bacterium]
MDKIDRLVSELRDFPAFVGEDEYQLRAIARHVTEHRLSEGEVLLREGDPARTVYLLITGRASVSVGGNVVAESGPGSILGEMGMLDHSTSAATVTVTEPGLALMVDWLGFEALMDSRAFSHAIGAGLAERLRRHERREPPAG